MLYLAILLCYVVDLLTTMVVHVTEYTVCYIAMYLPLVACNFALGLIVTNIVSSLTQNTWISYRKQFLDHPMSVLLTQIHVIASAYELPNLTDSVVII